VDCQTLSKINRAVFCQWSLLKVTDNESEMAQIVYCDLITDMLDLFIFKI
jgi:hypothetical protein